MATNPVETGPTGERTAENIAGIRKDRGLNQRDVSDRLNQLGRPMLASVVSKIEKLQRRVDVDDLVALAVVLEVSPNRLLLPNTTPESLVPPGAPPGQGTELTPTVAVTAQQAWRWASGEAPLPVRMPWEGEARSSSEGWRDFQRRNRPHDSAPMSFEEVINLRAKLSGVWEAAKQVAAEEGIPLATIANFILLMRDWERIEQISPRDKEE